MDPTPRDDSPEIRSAAAEGRQEPNVITNTDPDLENEQSFAQADPRASRRVPTGQNVANVLF
jgi:hypothetical protein